MKTVNERFMRGSLEAYGASSRSSLQNTTPAAQRDKLLAVLKDELHAVRVLEAKIATAIAKAENGQ